MIVGGGLATARVVRSYREEGGRDPIVVLSSDSAPPYHRPPLSKRYLRGEIEADGTYVEPESFYAEHDAELRLQTHVARIDNGSVELSSGERFSYGRLVIASGATPRTLRVPGADLDGVFTLRTLANSAAIRERAKESRRAFVVGTSFIGLEVAASLTQLGLQVTVADRGTQLFRALETPPFSEHLADVFRERGVELLFQDEVSEFRGKGRLSSVATKAGEERDADLAVVGVGVAPNTSFLEDSGLELDDGVVVNERFETSRPGVYAVGDVARFYDPVFGRLRRIEHWSNANYHGVQLGKVLAGQDEGYDTVSSFFSEIFGASVRFFGDAAGHDDLVVHGDFREGKAVCLHTAEGTIVSALTMGAEDDEIERIKELIRSRAKVEAFRPG